MGAPWWLVTSILFGAALVQSSVLPELGLIRVRPDLVLLCVIVWAVLRGAREALHWAFAGGLLLDLLSGAPFGAGTLALVLVAFCSSVGEIGLFRSAYVLPLLTTFWGSVLYGLLFLFLMASFQLHMDWVAALRYVIVPNAVVNTACVPVVYWLLSKLERRTRRVVAIAW